MKSLCTSFGEECRNQKIKICVGSAEKTVWATVGGPEKMCIGHETKNESKICGGEVAQKNRNMGMASVIIFYFIPFGISNGIANDKE